MISAGPPVLLGRSPLLPSSTGERTITDTSYIASDKIVGTNTRISTAQAHIAKDRRRWYSRIAKIVDLKDIRINWLLGFSTG